MNPEPEGRELPPVFWSSRYGLGLLLISGAAAYFLLTEHLAHTVAVLPYVLLLACALMHVFMHGRHGWHHERGGARENAHSGPRRPGGTS